MPEISLNLLKEKIIKTDTVITLLADKNEKITQLREKLKLLYHKYVNRLKECEVLQLKIDLCKLEHEPLQENFKLISKKYQDLQTEHENLTNVSQIRYQTKCKELELQIKKYEELTIQKHCNACQEVNVKYDLVCKKYDKINKQFNKLTEKYNEEQAHIKNTFSKFGQTEKDYVNQLKCLKENHGKEILKLQDNIASIQLSKQKLEEEIIDLNNKIALSISQKNLNYQASTYTGELNDNNFINEEEIETDTNVFSGLEDDEFQYILNDVSSDSIPALLSPLSVDLIFNQVDENKQESSELCSIVSADAPLSGIASLSNKCQNEIIEMLENCSSHSEQTTRLLESDFKISYQSLLSNFSEENSNNNLEVHHDNTEIAQTSADEHKGDANVLSIDSSNTVDNETSNATNNIGVMTTSNIVNTSKEGDSIELNVKQTAEEQKCTLCFIYSNRKRVYRNAYLDQTDSLKEIIDFHRNSTKYIPLILSDSDLIGFSINNELNNTVKTYKVKESLLGKSDGNISTSCEENNSDIVSQTNKSYNEISNRLGNTAISEISISEEIDSDSLEHSPLFIQNSVVCNNKLIEEIHREPIDIENIEKNLMEELIINSSPNFCETVSNLNENEMRSSYSICKNNKENACHGICNDFILSDPATQEHSVSSLNMGNVVSLLITPSFCNNLENKRSTEDNNLLDKKSTVLSLQHNDLKLANSFGENDYTQKTSNISEVNSKSNVALYSNDTEIYEKSNSLFKEFIPNGNVLSCDVSIFKENSSEDLNTVLNANPNSYENSVQNSPLHTFHKLITTKKDQVSHLADKQMPANEICNADFQVSHLADKQMPPNEICNADLQVSHLDDKKMPPNEICNADFELPNKVESIIPSKCNTKDREQPSKHPSLKISQHVECNNRADDGPMPTFQGGILLDQIILNRQNCKSNNSESANLNNSCKNVLTVHEEANFKTNNFEYDVKNNSDSTADIVDRIINSQKESNKYIFRTVLGYDILGFTKKSDKYIQRNRKKTIRNKALFLYKMKQELFKSLVRYFNKKITLNSTPSLYKKRTKCHSSKFKNLRKQQMLRWRRFRELYLPSTDTDSDYSKKFVPIKRKVKNKGQTQQNAIKSRTDNQLSSISEDEYAIREIFKEERNYQTLISNHKALEDFYHMPTDVEDNLKLKIHKTNTIFKNIDDSNISSGTMSELSINKDDSNSDSGYVKSDVDYSNVNKINRRKRTFSKETVKMSVSKRKCTITNDQDYKICDVNLEISINDLEKKCVQNNSIGEVDSSIDNEKNIFVTKVLDNIERESLEVNSININDEAVNTKKDVTRQICYLLCQSESVSTNEVVDDSSTFNNGTDLAESSKDNCEKTNDLQYLFGTDCESICSSDDDNSLSNTEINNEDSYVSNKRKRKDIINMNKSGIYSLRSNTKRNNKIKDGTLKLQTVESPYLKVNNSAKNCQKRNIAMKTILKRCSTSLSKIKATAAEDKRKMKLRNREIDLCIESEELSNTEAVTPENDPLHIRLQQENQLRIARDNTKSNNTVQSSYKRSNSLKKQVKFLDSPANPLDIIAVQNIKTVEECKVNLKTKRLSQVKARVLLKKLLTFPDRTSITDEVAEAFSGQEHKHIFRIILHELSLDVSKVDTKYTPPAPVLTETQRIILGLLVKLDRTTSPGLLELFTLGAEKYLLMLTTDKIHMLERVTRLYLAICKLQRKIHRMRRMVCDSFYFMGDLSVPFLFTVLSTWTEVMPFESELRDEPLIKVIVEIIKKKKCYWPGYNLIALTKLLNVYYGYAMEESNVEETFLQIFNAFTETQSAKLEYAIVILCKNLEKSWVSEKIRLHMKPIIESGTDITLKMSITTLIRRITRDYNSVEINKLITFNKVPD